MPAAALRFIPYYRVSTQKQGQSGLGLEAQRAAVRTFVSNPSQIVAEFVEVESGKRNHRPQLLGAIEAARMGLPCSLPSSTASPATPGLSSRCVIVGWSSSAATCPMPIP